MASGFPGSIDSFTNPLSNSALNSPSHAGQHQDLNDAVNKIENYMGLVKVIPTAATNGTVAANGTVTVGNAVPFVTVTNAFSSLYDNYKIIYSGGTCSSTSDVVFSLGGITTGYYSFLIYTAYSANTISGLNEANTTTWSRAGSATPNSVIANFEIQNPFLTKPKHFATSHGFSTTTTGFYLSGGWINSTASATSFTLGLNAGTYTGGTIRVYGYRN